jgi:hypothetical protein
MATANWVSGSAHPIDPPAPGWPNVRGFLPAATIDRGGDTSPMLATKTEATDAAVVGHALYAVIMALGFSADGDIDEVVRAFIEDDIEMQKQLV